VGRSNSKAASARLAITLAIALVIALAIASSSLLIFCCGLCPFCQLASRSKEKRGGGLAGRSPQKQERGSRVAPGGGYLPVDMDDYEDGSYRGNY